MKLSKKNRLTCINAKNMALEAIIIKLCSIHSSPAWTHPLSFISDSKFFLSKKIK